MKTLTERQQGIKALRDLLRAYNVVLVGDVGIEEAYTQFLKENGVRMLRPTKRQIEHGKEIK